jgi:hypothetical protein
MGQGGEFRAGQRVRIRASADSEFAGHDGVIMHVGGNVCDVKIRYKPPGSKVRSTYIGTFQKSDLQSLRRPVDLAMFEARPSTSVMRQTSVQVSLVLMAVLLLLMLVLDR